MYLAGTWMYSTWESIPHSGLFSRGVYFANFEIAVIHEINVHEINRTTPTYLA